MLKCSILTLPRLPDCLCAECGITVVARQVPVYTASEYRFIYFVLVIFVDTVLPGQGHSLADGEA